MEPIPLPSHIHYELLLQLLERQTMRSVDRHHPLQEQVQELIITLRKAASQQRQIEETCQRSNLPIDYRWSLNEAVSVPKE
jgi:methyl coenzyme M reductase subunit D